MSRMKSSMQASIVRIITDATGGSHFVDTVEALVAASAAPPALPLSVSEPGPAKETRFIGAPAGWESPLHPAPSRRWIIILGGTVEVRTSDGAMRQFGPGAAIHLEDTTGVGHATRVLPGDDWVALIIFE
jgi:hypothetical protein